MLTSFGLYKIGYGHRIPKLLCALQGDGFIEEERES